MRQVEASKSERRKSSLESYSLLQFHYRVSGSHKHPIKHARYALLFLHCHKNMLHSTGYIVVVHIKQLTMQHVYLMYITLIMLCFYIADTVILVATKHYRVSDSRANYTNSIAGYVWCISCCVCLPATRFYPYSSDSICSSLQGIL